MKEVIFVGPQITQPFEDLCTELNSTERRTWKVFKTSEVTFQKMKKRNIVLKLRGS
jgi:hypothetical protein